MQRVVVFELELVGEADVSFQTAYPPFLRQNNGDRFFFDQRFQRNFNFFRHFGKLRTTTTERGFFAEFFLHLPDFGRNRQPAFAFVAEQLFQSRFFFGQFVIFFTNLAFFQFAQRTKLHVQNGFRLVVCQFELFHHDGFGIVFLADNLNNPVKVEVGNQITA